MHIYTNEEYLNKQKIFIKENLKPTINAKYCEKNSHVLKNYIYYEKPIKIT